MATLVALLITALLCRAEVADVQTLKQTAFRLLHQANYDEAIRCGTELLAAGRHTGDSASATLYGHIVLGQAGLMKGHGPAAGWHLQQARKLAETFRNDSALCSVYNGLGLYAANIEKDYYRSITHFFRGIEIARQCGYEQLYNIFLINIAGIFYLKDDPAGLPYALEAYERGHRIRNPYLIAAASANTSYMYYLCNDFDQALRYAAEAKFVMKQNGFYDRTNVYALYGMIRLAQGETDDAIANFEQGLAERAEAQASSVVYALLGYGQALRSQRQYNRAIAVLEEALQLTTTTRNAIYRDRVLKELSLCNETMGHTEAALRWQRRFQTERDSLFDADKERALSDLRIKYDTERHENRAKEVQLALLKKTKREQLLTVLLLTVGLTVGLLFYFAWRRNRCYRAIVDQYQARMRSEKQWRHEVMALEQSADNSPQPAAAPSRKYGQSSLTREKGSDLFAQLEQLMRESKLYRDKLLTKEKVADALESNRTYLSQVINQQTSLTFTQYINEFRISEALRLLDDSGNCMPLKAISVEVGFSSMTTFYKAFRHTVGMTPSQYKERTERRYTKH